MTNQVAYLAAALLGLCLGSFLNVVVLRDGERASIVTGRSRCPHCRHALAWYDLVPVLSFLSLGGRCRYCRKPISLQYPLVELAAALLAVFSVWLGLRADGNWWMSAGVGLSSLIFLVISVIDLRTFLIPVEYCVAAALLGAAGMFLGHEFSVQPLIGALVGGGSIAGILYGWKALFKQDGMGVGDIWMAAAIGAVVGYPLIWIALFSAFVSGAVVGVLAVGFSRKSMQTALPFGPFLFFGLLFALAWGQTILSWYIL